MTDRPTPLPPPREPHDGFLPNPAELVWWPGCGRPFPLGPDEWPPKDTDQQADDNDGKDIETED